MGFVILMLRAPPRDDVEVAGKRILFRHRDAFSSPSDPKVSRDRSEALALAQQATKQLRSGAVTIDELLAASDTSFGVPSGDIGIWKVKDPGPFPRQIEALAQLQVGAISDPIETVLGFEIFQRTEVTPRPIYAMRAIQIHVNEKGAGGDDETLTGSALADSIADTLRRSPDRFDSFVERYCCAGTQRWTHGRGPVGLEPILDQLAVGEIAAKPFLSGWHYYIAKRVDPASVPDDPLPQYELPAPAAAQLAPLVEEGEGTSLAQRTRELAKETVASMKLEPSQSAEIGRLFEALATAFEAHPGPDDGSLRVQSLQTTQAAFLKALGPAQHRRLNEVIDGFVTRMLLNGPA
jgi:hypothetical protein